jgi:hypothetical protein
MFADFTDLIALFNKHNAKYLVIGDTRCRGTRNRATPKTSTSSFCRHLTTRRPSSARSPNSVPRCAPARSTTATRALTAKDFEDKGTWYTMGMPPYAIDILPEIPGVTFDTAWNNRSTQVVDAATGLTAHFISRDDLISAKLAAGRDQDLIDVKALRHAAAAEMTAAPTPPSAPKPRKSRRK